MLLRIDETALIVVLDDSQACARLAEEGLRRVTGPLSPVQLREVAARMAANNIHLKERPQFRSDFNLFTEEYSIIGLRPKQISLVDWNNEILGRLMTHYCGPMLPDTPNRPQVLESLKTGSYTFVLNDRGEFAADHMDSAPADSPIGGE